MTKTAKGKSPAKILQSKLEKLTFTDELVHNTAKGKIKYGDPCPKCGLSWAHGNVPCNYPYPAPPQDTQEAGREDTLTKTVMKNGKVLPSDLQPFVHGEEETHWCCEARLKNEGGKARCCECVPHDGCIGNTPPETGREWEDGMKTKTQEYMDLYKKGYSTYQIGKMFGVLNSTVRENLQRHGVSLRYLGKDIENEVADYLESEGHAVVRQKGDCSYDLLVDGVRVDVKSAHKNLISCKNCKNDRAYMFEVKHVDARYTDYHKDKDELYLVFLDEVGRPIYSLATKDIHVKIKVKITYINNTKYPLKFIGYLDKEMRSEQKRWEGELRKRVEEMMRVDPTYRDDTENNIHNKALSDVLALIDAGKGK